ncbi:hypothetical protein COV04_03725 [Candidatus Uhrbacteria bacterium CG10_big_fil_rev_8_21_14_0_10_48_11]|uniref:DNA polymerase III subunit delta n=1 Tax=Candidatus Uhrbacteria bacterium CG10_big_fil_rev_8_21_14_0_10_48_11 TaxID=1975037 RepID=A0A2M8LE02_9BACT|nr:MAG: hypothetical protein COV04_03725 [Candidatus Uhrbacteria bacterium CG10_big_fil_rev_8_21_14_0_10_48_11]
MHTFIGQEKWQTFFSNAIANGKLNHAYLFSGPAHLGKQTFARLLAAKLLGQTGDTQRLHPDLLVLTEEASQTVGIATVRQFITAISSSPLVGNRRVALIPETERVTVQSWNALLKTLEEPPPATIFFLIAEHPEKLPATVRSRLQYCRLAPVPVATLSRALQRRGASHALAEELAAVSGGRPGLALGWFSDKAAYETYKKTTQQFIELCAGSRASRFAFTETVAKESSFARADLLRLVDVWSLLVRDGLLFAMGESELIIHRYLQKELATLLGAHSLFYWRDVALELVNLRRRLEAYSNRRLALNAFFFTLSI